MVNAILPRDPDNNQLKNLQLKTLKQTKTFEKLVELSFELFDELRKHKQGEHSSALIKFRWVINDLL
jgi:hypothetical protein